MGLKANVPPVVCVRVVEILQGTEIPAGVEVAWCGGCQAPIYLSPSSKALIGRGALQATCLECASLLTGANVLAELSTRVAQELKQWDQG